MFPTLFTLVQGFQRKLRRNWLKLPAIGFLLIVSGCKTWDYRGEGFSDHDLSETARQARSERKEKNNEYWTFSTKARQIERDLLSQ